MQLLKEVKKINIKVYSTENCVKCRLTMRKFGEYNISPQVVMANASIRADLASLDLEIPAIFIKDNDGAVISMIGGATPETVESLIEGVLYNEY